jgi:predicted NUDIX family phosphoesterase
MADKMQERILCFPTSALDELGRFQGLSTDVARYFPAIVTPPLCRYVPRHQAETDEGLKQVIPYVLFLYQDSIFSYRRGKRGSESRLHDLHSVGIGGHIDEARDHNLFAQDETVYYEALRREVAEEVSVDYSDMPPCTALINDDSTPVGRVHFGVVHIVQLPRAEIAKKESPITSAAMVDMRQALAQLDHYETWSQLCLENLPALLKNCGSATGTAPVQQA